MAKLLRDHGAKETRKGYTDDPATPEGDAICKAARDGDLAKVKAMLEKNPALVGSRSSKADEFNSGGMPLHWAVVKDHREVAAFLLAHGADINAKTSIGLTPLHVAADKGLKDMVVFLLAHKAAIDPRAYEGGTPLKWAAEFGKKDLLEALVSGGADVNARDYQGSTPIFSAISRDNKTAVEVLLAHKADVNARSTEGGTPLSAAVAEGDKDIVALLIKSGATIDEKDNDGDTALSMPDEFDNHQPARALLLANKADVTIAHGAGPSFAKAADCVRTPQAGFGNMSPSELQVTYRIAGLYGQLGYKPRDIDLPKWKALLNDPNENIYGRLAAAYILSPADPDALSFVSGQLDSHDLRHRYNATEVLLDFLREHPDSQPGTLLLLKHLADGSLDGSGVTSSPYGNFSDGDRDDIMWDSDRLNWMDWSRLKQYTEALPLLKSAMAKKGKWSSWAAERLAELGDAEGTAALVQQLKENPAGADIPEYGKIKCKDAAPILAGMLSKTSIYPTEKDQRILEALAEIGDPQAAGPIKNFLNQKHAEGDKAVARRALAQLDTGDPAISLAALFDRETHLPEQSFSTDNERANILYALARYPDNPHAVAKLSSIAETCDAAFLRRDAIYELGQIKTRVSLLELASLLDRKFPSKLTTLLGWKGDAPDFPHYFPDLAASTLAEATHQDFGHDCAAWKRWIETSGIK
jgi:ankyrin repeat protein/HEAT repeat protein